MAINDYNRAIDANPDYAPAYYNRGFIFLSIGKKNEAIFDFQSACNLGDIIGCRFSQILQKELISNKQ